MANNTDILDQQLGRPDAYTRNEEAASADKTMNVDDVSRPLTPVTHTRLPLWKRIYGATVNVAATQNSQAQTAYEWAGNVYKEHLEALSIKFTRSESEKKGVEAAAMLQAQEYEAIINRKDDELKNVRAQLAINDGQLNRSQERAKKMEKDLESIRAKHDNTRSFLEKHGLLREYETKKLSLKRSAPSLPVEPTSKRQKTIDTTYPDPATPATGVVTEATLRERALQKSTLKRPAEEAPNSSANKKKKTIRAPQQAADVDTARIIDVEPTRSTSISLEAGPTNATQAPSEAALPASSPSIAKAEPGAATQMVGLCVHRDVMRSNPEADLPEEDGANRLLLLKGDRGGDKDAVDFFK